MDNPVILTEGEIEWLMNCILLQDKLHVVSTPAQDEVLADLMLKGMTVSEAISLVFGASNDLR